MYPAFYHFTLSWGAGHLSRLLSPLSGLFTVCSKGAPETDAQLAAATVQKAEDRGPVASLCPKRAKGFQFGCLMDQKNTSSQGLSGTCSVLFRTDCKVESESLKDQNLSTTNRCAPPTFTQDVDRWPLSRRDLQVIVIIYLKVSRRNTERAHYS